MVLGRQDKSQWGQASLQDFCSPMQKSLLGDPKLHPFRLGLHWQEDREPHTLTQVEVRSPVLSVINTPFDPITEKGFLSIPLQVCHVLVQRRSCVPGWGLFLPAIQMFLLLCKISLKLNQRFTVAGDCQG